MYIYTVTVARLSIILDFFPSLLSLPLTLTSLFFSFPLSAHSYRSTLSHAIKSTLSFHQITSLSPTHATDSSLVADLLWIRSTLSDHGCWFSLDRWFVFFFFGFLVELEAAVIVMWVWVDGIDDCGCGSVGCRSVLWVVFFGFFFCWMPVSILLLSGRLEARLMIVVAWWQWLWGLCWEMTMLKKMIILLNKCIE